MDRHEGYRVLIETLDDWRGRTFDEVCSCVGSPTESRVTRGDEEFIVYVTVYQVVGDPGALRVVVAVDSTSPWTVERLEEACVVRGTKRET